MCKHSITIRLSIGSPPIQGGWKMEYCDPRSSIIEFSSAKRRHGIPAGIEGDRLVCIRISDHSEGIFPRLYGVDRVPDHSAQHDDSLVGRRQMLLGSVGDHPLAFLRDTVLFMGVKIPPAVLNPFVNAGLAFFESLRFERHVLSRLAVLMRIEIEPISCGLEIIRGHAKPDHLPGIFANTGGRVTYM